MHKSLELGHSIVAASFALLFAFAQTGDADKTTTIKGLLTTMNTDAVIKGQGEVLINSAKQGAPLVLEQVLVENKTLSDKQRQTVVDKLEKNSAIQRMTDGVDKDFDTEAFRKGALQAHYDSLGGYYLTQEIRDPTAFLKTPSDQKLMANQGKATQEVWGNAVREYGSQVGKKIRDITDKGVITAAATK